MSPSPLSFSAHPQKVLSFVFCTVYFVLGNIAFAACQPEKSCNPKSDPLGYSCYDKGKYSYQCNVENFCLGQTKWADPLDHLTTDKQLLKEHNMSKYPDLSKWKAPSFEDIRKIYEETQNSVMNCATLKSKYELHKSLMKDYGIPKRSMDILKKNNQIIEKQIKEKKCIESREGDKVYNYKDLLDSMTYEQCWYSMYLHYYEQSGNSNIGVLGAGKKVTSVSDWNNLLWTHKNQIAAERELSERTMETALTLYENHERTYPSHVLLDVTKDQMAQQERQSRGFIDVMKKFVNLMFNAQDASVIWDQVRV